MSFIIAGLFHRLLWWLESVDVVAVVAALKYGQRGGRALLLRSQNRSTEAQMNHQLSLF